MPSKLAIDARREIPGLVAVTVAAFPVAWAMWTGVLPPTTPTVLAWWGCVAGFVVAFVVGLASIDRPRLLVTALLAQTALALAANWLIPMAIEGVALTAVLLVVTAAGLANLPHRVAVAWVTAQSVGLTAIYASGWPLPIALAAGGAYATLQMVIHSRARLALVERDRRVALESTVRELRSTRAMLEATVRAAERTEIARDLHDVLGHHLIALGLLLDTAADHPEPQDRIAEARQLVRLLLADVREVVAELHDHDGIDLGPALERLATDGPGPRVTVHVAAAASDQPGPIAQVLLRCAQESLTNARKHAGATLVHIELEPTRLTVADDGRGPTDLEAGFGVTGMAERCAAVGCTLRVEARPTGGTAVVVALPAEDAA